MALKRCPLALNEITRYDRDVTPDTSLALSMTTSAVHNTYFLFVNHNDEIFFAHWSQDYVILVRFVF